MKNLKNNLLNVAIRQAISNKAVRNIALKKLDARVHVSILSDKSLLFQQEKYDRYYFVSAVLKQVSKCLDRGSISREVAQRMIKIFMNDSFKINREAHLTDTKYEYATKYGEYPPKFLVLSPEKACNLECVGCYASCGSRKSVHLDFDLSRRIIREAHDILGSRFITISGGEPLMYQSQGENYP